MMPHCEPNFYQRLGVTPGATPAQLKQAYRAQVLATHPDLHRGADPDRFRLLKRAYEVLANPEERRRYDMAMGLGEAGQRPGVYTRSFERLFASLFFGLRATVLSVRELSEQVEVARRKAG
jgi:DnaJ-class molecular chaperone